MIAIGTVTSNQKLELVRMIRMQNQSNRNECREKERFLYGSPQIPVTGRGELYGTEITAVMDTGINGEGALPKEAFLLHGFRLRFFLAVIIMVLFIYMDKTKTPFFGKTTEELAVYLTQSISVEETLNSFDL